MTRVSVAPESMNGVPDGIADIVSPVFRMVDLFQNFWLFAGSAGSFFHFQSSHMCDPSHFLHSRVPFFFIQPRWTLRFHSSKHKSPLQSQRQGDFFLSITVIVLHTAPGLDGAIVESITAANSSNMEADSPTKEQVCTIDNIPLLCDIQHEHGDQVG